MLKGAKREMFVAGIFTEIRPVWVGYLVTKPKNIKKVYVWGLILPFISWDFCFSLKFLSVVAYSAKNCNFLSLF